MASRPELVEIMQELNVPHDGMTIEEMKDVIRKEADKRWGKYDVRSNKLCTTHTKSRTLLRFLTEEYDFSLFDKEGNKVDIDGNKI